VTLKLPAHVTLEPRALRDADRAGAVVLRVTTPLTVVEAVSLAASLPVPAGWDGEAPDGWGIAAPPGAMLKITSHIDARAGTGELVPKGSPLLVNYAWPTPRILRDGTRRVLVRCVGSTSDALNVYPVDIYSDQIASLQAIGGAPFRVPGWELVRLDGRPASDAGPLVVPSKPASNATNDDA